MKQHDTISTISNGKYTFILTEVNDRPKEMPQPNFLGTGKALVAIKVNSATEAKECHQEVENSLNPRNANHKPYIRWGKEDLSNVGTTTII